MLKNSNAHRNTQESDQDLSFICHKVNNFVYDDILKRYEKEFLNKPIESKYFFNKFVEYEIGVRFLKQLKQHKLFKFIGTNRKFNPYPVKAFYCNLKVSNNGLEHVFHNQVIKFMLYDFKHPFGLVSKGNEVCILNALGFDRVEFV